MSVRSRSTLQLKTRLIPILVGLLTVLQLTIPYRGWVLFLVVIGGLLLLCYYWTRALSRSIVLSREVRFGWTQVGDRLEERFVLTNSCPLPALWLEVHDHSNMPNYDTSRGTGVDGNGISEWRTSGQCMHRGVFSLGPTSITTGDPFGLFSVQIEFDSTRSLLVLPPIIPLPPLKVAAGGRTGIGRPRPNAAERTVSVSGVREYTPGDDWRWVHWATTARWNSLYVRLFESTPASDWWIMLDVHEQAQAGSGERSTLEHSITLAASLVDRGLRERRSVGFTTHGAQLAWHPPRSGDTQRWKILREMASLSVGQLPLREYLSSMRPTIGRQTSLIVITADVGGDWVDELMLMMRAGTQPTVLLFDPSAYVDNGNTQAANAMHDLLVSLGVACYLFGPEAFMSPEARPGQQGSWNLRGLPTGMVVSIGQQNDESWKALS